MSGFIYEVTCIARDGSVKWVEKTHNIIPLVGVNYILSAALNNGGRYSAWFIGLYANSYSPTTNDTMTTFAASAGELTTQYSETTREAFVPDGITAGIFSNYNSPAEFTFTSGATVRGGFITTDATKGSTSGVLLSAALFNSPKVVSVGEALKINAGLQLISV